MKDCNFESKIIFKKFSNTHNTCSNNKYFFFLLKDYWLITPLVVNLFKIKELKWRIFKLV